MSDAYCACGSCVLCTTIAEQAAETRIMDAATLRAMVRRERKHSTDPAWSACICQTMPGSIAGDCPFCSSSEDE